MAEQLMNNIRLWSVEGIGCMADVLGAVEDFEGEAVQELPLSEEATNGF